MILFGRGGLYMNFYILWLTKIFNGNNKELNKLLNLISAEKAFNCTRSELEEFNFSLELNEKLLSEKIKDDAKRDFEFCQKEDIKIVDITSKEYPHNLLNISSPPPLLYYKGNLLPKDEISISIVGSRNYSEYGKNCTKKFAYELASGGITVVSGMAYGIDSFAHLYSINAKGRTIAVLGSGVDIIYPDANKKLYYDIIENGAVISEFPLHTPPISKNFPIRNRIVAGFSLGTLVIEANNKSGTMITARLAAEAGRNVYAIPGQIFTPSSFGTNSLIKDGAKIVTCPEDIIGDIYSEISQTIPETTQLTLFNQPKLSDEENFIYKELSLEPISIDKLVEKLGIPSSKISATLAMMQLEGIVLELPGKKYVVNSEF